jgi:hypothetical protein
MLNRRLSKLGAGGAVCTFIVGLVAKRLGTADIKTVARVQHQGFLHCTILLLVLCCARGRA